ncbi:hypothetical protein UFOVP331_115 [uncultured Caudovirales phage]|uniref:Uncharacterized protein n=1 Tax=uncultured Caudovirales phage TaxID=2100421 RepID=A0A6J5LVS8_9CAUD|nr:hypothetical protein UFOVP331_115 [uncultured Caudovirales phage]
MTYKEKAKELIYKYEDLTDGWDYYNDCSKELKQKLPSMKEGALITINEILKIIDETMQGWMDVDIIFYWKQVRNEVEKYELEE